jgi:hypothetical protein
MRFTKLEKIEDGEITTVRVTYYSFVWKRERAACKIQFPYGHRYETWVYLDNGKHVKADHAIALEAFISSGLSKLEF